MSTSECPWCGGDALEGTTCPKSIKCPRCKAGAGQRCKRPSGHVATELHTERVEMAESLDVPAGAGSLWTISSGYGGTVYATRVPLEDAVTWIEPQHSSRADLERLAIGEQHRTHPDARGIVAHRVA